MDDSDQLIADDGCRLWVRRAGHGEPLVLCHGGPGVWDYFDDVAGMLNGFRTIRWDQRGCGRSGRRGPYTFARSVADLDAVCRHTGAGRVALLGHSWGASLALLYALQYPDRVSRLVYVSGTGVDPEPTWKPQYRQNLRRCLGAHLPRWEALQERDRTEEEEREMTILQWSADFAEPDIAVRHAERMATPWFGINYECNASIGADVRRYLHDHDVIGLCRALDVPTLIVDGAQDIRPRWAVDSLAEALPDVQRVTMSGAGHMPWVEQPELFRESITCWGSGTARVA